MPEFDVEVSAEHAHLDELCAMYWAIDANGSFTYTVKAIAERFEQPPHKVSKIVSEACFVRSDSQRCNTCNKGFTYRSRSDWTSRNRFIANRCKACVDAVKRQQEEERKRADSAKAEAILATYTVGDEEFFSRATDLDLPEALALAALLEDAEEISDGTTIPTDKRADRLTPTSDYDFTLLDRLINQRLVRVHPSSRPNTFEWDDDGTLTGRYYPVLASYYLPGVGPLASRVKGYLQSVASVISRENWPDHWVNQLSGFWLDLAVEECKAYLVFMLKERRLPFTPGPKTDDVFRRALKWYSIGQVYNFIWRAAKSCVDYHARERVLPKHAANSAISRISGYMERAYSKGWKVDVYQRDSRLPLSTLSHILFIRALGLADPMTYSPVDLPVRRAGLELAWHNIDSDTFERLISQLVGETEGYENVEWLMHTNAPDHGRDVSATRLRQDPLSGHSSQRVAIQCKHWLSRPVRDIDVNQALVSISHWQDPPFDVLVIATSGRFTSDAVAWIERHNARGTRPNIELWNDARLEVLLNDRPHLVHSYELR